MNSKPFSKAEISRILEFVAMDISSNPDKPNYSNKDFMNALIIFQSAVMDKMYDNQTFDNMGMEDRCVMAEHCGNELKKFIHTYTNLDTHKTEQFL